MEITQYYLTNNDCYKAGRKITPRGIMVHSTGANNPNLRRYIGPDDGILGVNRNGNHWNRPGVLKCVHAFIGKDKNGKARIYQTLPWDHRGWHAGGRANDTHISFEICEDDLSNANYFNEVYRLAVGMCAMLCENFNLAVSSVIGHYEGYQRGIASNHADPGHWFPKHGKSMDAFRADVQALLNGEGEDSEVIKRGDRGPEVAEWQAKLVELGYDLGDFGPNDDGIDGNFGAVTQEAVENFQRDNGLPVTGDLDLKTMIAIEVKLAGGSNAEVDALRKEVAELKDRIEKMHQWARQILEA